MLSSVQRANDCFGYCLISSLSAISPLFPLLSILQHDDQYPYKDGSKVYKQVQGMLDVVSVPIFCLLDNDLHAIQVFRI